MNWRDYIANELEGSYLTDEEIYCIMLEDVDIEDWQETKHEKEN